MAGQPQQRATLEAVGRWLKAEQREYVAALKQFGLSTDNAVIGREFKRTSDPAEYQQLVAYLEREGRIKEKPKAPPRPRAERLPKGEGWHRIPNGYEGTFQGRHWIISYSGRPSGEYGGWDVAYQVHPGEQGEYGFFGSEGARPADKSWMGEVRTYGKRGALYQIQERVVSMTKDDIDQWARSKTAEQYRRKRGE